MNLFQMASVSCVVLIKKFNTLVMTSLFRITLQPRQFHRQQLLNQMAPEVG